MPREWDGSLSTPWWMKPASTTWPNCAACRIGRYATGWRRCRAWRRWRPSAALSSNTRCNSTPTSWPLTAFLSRRSSRISRGAITTWKAGSWNSGDASTWSAAAAISATSPTLKPSPWGRTARARRFESRMWRASPWGRICAAGSRNWTEKGKWSAASSLCGLAKTP